MLDLYQELLNSPVRLPVSLKTIFGETKQTRMMSFYNDYMFYSKASLDPKPLDMSVFRSLYLKWSRDTDQDSDLCFFEVFPGNPPEEDEDWEEEEEEDPDEDDPDDDPDD